MSYQERNMHAGQTNFEETFSVPPGLTSVMVFSREKLSNLQFDNGQFAAAGGGNLTSLAGVAVHDAANNAVVLSVAQVGSMQISIGSKSEKRNMKTAQNHYTELF